MFIHYKILVTCFVASQVIVSSYSEITENEYLDPRTAQVAIVDHVKQVHYFFILVVLHYGVP